MSNFFKGLTGIVVALLLVSCSSSYESKGHDYYKEAQNKTGHEERMLKKKAYTFYKQALKAHPDKISPQLRDQFLEMTLFRAEMVMTEGGANMEAIPFFIADLDKHSPNSTNAIKERYAAFLGALADSSFNQKKLYQGMAKLDKAIKVAPNSSVFKAKKAKIIDNFAIENFEAAELEFINGETNKDTESFVRAEFFVKVALMHDPNMQKAKDLLSKIYEKNVSNYSVYDAVVMDKPDTSIYDKINTDQVFLAVPTKSIKGRRATLKADIYNYSSNPQRLRPKNFFLVDVNGKKYKALGSSKIEREIIDQEIETKLTLRFKTGSAKIKKLLYVGDNPLYKAEKNFF